MLCKIVMDSEKKGKKERNPHIYLPNSNLVFQVC